MSGPTPNPNFPVITVGHRNRDQDPANLQLILDRVNQLTAEGKTDGVDYTGPEPTAFNIYRNWVDVNAANEWISFLLGLGDPAITDIKIYS